MKSKASNIVISAVKDGATELIKDAVKTIDRSIEENAESVLNIAKDLTTRKSKEAVDHPSHYGGDSQYEVIKVLEAWELGFHLGNVVKYISRAGKKDKGKELEDLNKAKWYLERYIAIKSKENKVEKR